MFGDFQVECCVGNKSKFIIELTKLQNVESSCLFAGFSVKNDLFTKRK